MTTTRALLVLTFVLVGCNDSSFTGASTPQPVVAKPVVTPQTTVPVARTEAAQVESGSAAAPAVPPAIATDCGAAGVTQARLLTPVLDVTASDAHLEYEIYRTDCDGVIQAFAADKIYFDMDAYDAYSDMKATLTQDGAPVATILKLTVGSDLFGHTGNTWAHQETSEKVALQGNSKSVRLRIDVSGRALTPREQPAAGPAADGSVPIATFLRFGDAAPVQVDVTALHPGKAPSATL